MTCTNGGFRLSPPYYVEMRCKLLHNVGAWPAFWMLTSREPDNYTFTAAQGSGQRAGEIGGMHDWSVNEGEIDFFEFFGHRPTIHTSGAIVGTGQVGYGVDFFDEHVDLSLDFHTSG